MELLYRQKNKALQIQYQWILSSFRFQLIYFTFQYITIAFFVINHIQYLIQFVHIINLNKIALIQQNYMKKKPFAVWEKQILQQSNAEKQSKPKLAKIVDQPLQCQLKSVQQLKCLMNEVFDGKYYPQKLQYREKQEIEINQFIQKCLNNECNYRCLLLTGMPGSGKTSLCTRILTERKIKSIRLNANIFKNIKQLLNILTAELFDTNNLKKPTIQQFLSLLNKQRTNIEKTVIMVDQIDTLFKYEDSNSIQFFNIFKHPQESLILIGISNTMQMLYNIGEKYHLQLPSIKNIVFSPYSIEQTQKIILLRLEEMYRRSKTKIIFEDRSLKFSTSKIYNSKGGDLRHIIQFIKKILDEVINKIHQLKENTEIKIRLEDANKVLRLLNSKSRNTVILTSLPFHQQLIMVSIYNLFNKNDNLGVTVKQIYKQLSWICKGLAIQAASINEITETLGFLESYGFLVIKEKKSTKKQKIIMPKISVSEIEDAYLDHSLLKRFFDTET